MTSRYWEVIIHKYELRTAADRENPLPAYKDGAIRQSLCISRNNHNCLQAFVHNNEAFVLIQDITHSK